MTAALATARRVLRQLRHDPRTIGLMLVVPSVLMVLVRYMLNSAALFTRIAPAMLAFFPFVIMFLVTSVTTLRERTSGTLERVMTTPASKPSFIGGYALTFGAVAAVQAAVTVLVCVALGMDVAASVRWLVLVAVVNGVLGVALGLLGSAFARTEFQAVQMMPVIVLPQVLLCGLFVPRDLMAPALQWLSDLLPMSYAIEAMQTLTRSTTVDATFARDVAVVAGFAVAALVFAAATLRRRTA